MTPIERTVAVLNRWCGEDAVDHTDEKLEDLWNRTKPTGKPSHSGIDFFEQGAEDLVDRLKAEFQKAPARNINFTHTSLDPDNGTILTVDDLFTAVLQSPPVAPTVVSAVLSPEAHNALVEDIVARLTPAGKPAATSARKVKKAVKKKQIVGRKRS